MFRIRVDIVSDLNADSLMEVCQPTSHVVVRHELPHGNPHYHAFVETDLKDNALRQRFKRRFPFLAPSDFSIKKCDPDRVNDYVQYLFNNKHGNQWELIDVNNFDSQLLDRLQIQAKAITDQFASSQTTKRDKPTIYELAMKVRKVFTDRHHIQSTLDNLGKPQLAPPPEGLEEYREHLEIAIQICRQYKQPFEENYLRRLVSTAIAEGASGRRTIISNILGKIFG